MTDFHPPEPPQRQPRTVALKVTRGEVFLAILGKIASSMSLLFVALCLGALVASACWNGLTDLTTLPKISFAEAFTGLLFVRILGFFFNN
jgi:hypothetical protein